ncbi:hypothetical protein [Aureivirga marina]|uniref:hypothetical protein n=1 Tax=Aureivirga marina TaxID=1182451 RepID=UPI0018CACB3D|nr:hypothetical protein [Aureivirga marina]
MIYINPNQQHIQEAKDAHYNGMISKIKKKLNKERVRGTKPLFDKIESNLKEILIGEPKQLEEIHLDIINQPSYNRFIKRIRRIFNYNIYFVSKENEYGAYEMSKKININSCTYCNRMYTKTVLNDEEIEQKNKKITRPEFDHWFSQKDHPILSLSFFNLIPSCTICNSVIKRDIEFKLGKYIHPYIDSEINFKFSYKLNSLSEYEFKIKNKNNCVKTDNTVKAFKLKEIYETHEDELIDLIKIQEKYTDRYLEILDNTFPNIHISKEEAYRLAFGTFPNEEDFHKRPLSRMKRDILKELGVLKE